jgi:hypothetical protein
MSCILPSPSSARGQGLSGRGFFPPPCHSNPMPPCPLVRCAQEAPPSSPMPSLAALARVVGLAAVLGTVVATCPFQCHGHGFCTGGHLETCDCWDPWKGDLLCSGRAWLLWCHVPPTAASGVGNLRRLLPHACRASPLDSRPPSPLPTTCFPHPSMGWALHCTAHGVCAWVGAATKGCPVSDHVVRWSRLLPLRPRVADAPRLLGGRPWPVRGVLKQGEW